MSGLDVIEPLKLKDPRSATAGAHRYVRELILSGKLVAGTVISQVCLADALGISRTPLREALRMLQEEGLVEAEANRRCRIAGFSPTDVDSVYSARLMLECLGMRITLPLLGSLEIGQLRGALEMMRECEAAIDITDPKGPSAAWRNAHHTFHRVLVSRAPVGLFEQIVSQSERSERYLRLLTNGRPFGSRDRLTEHREVLDSVLAGDFTKAVNANCKHIGRTALILLTDFAADFEPVGIRSALKLIVKDAEFDKPRSMRGIKDRRVA